MKNSVLSDKVRLLKEHEKGVTQMCKIMEEFAKEERAEARSEAKLEFAEKLIKQNKMTLEEIAEMTELPSETVKQLAEKYLR